MEKRENRRADGCRHIWGRNGGERRELGGGERERKGKKRREEEKQGRNPGKPNLITRVFHSADPPSADGPKAGADPGREGSFSAGSRVLGPVSPPFEGTH